MENQKLVEIQKNIDSNFDSAVDGAVETILKALSLKSFIFTIHSSVYRRIFDKLCGKFTPKSTKFIEIASKALFI